MNVKKDLYREKQVRLMLKTELDPAVEHYSGKLHHDESGAKPINVEADALAVLADSYAGKYIEVNEPENTQTTPKYSYWAGSDEYDALKHALLFVNLPHLNNRDVVSLLAKFDTMYGDADLDVEDWAVEYQVLTRMLIHRKSLLVNPLYLDVSEDETVSELTDGMADEDKAAYMDARNISREEIWQKYQESIEV